MALTPGHSTRKPAPSAVWLLGCVGAGFVLLVTIGAIGAHFENRAKRSKLASLDAQIAAFLPPSPKPEDSSVKHLYVRPGDPGSTSTNAAYLRGKLLLVEVEERNVALQQLDLPPELRAHRPEEVGTVVWLRRGEFESNFIRPAGRVTYYYELAEIMDWKEKRRVGRIVYDGPSKISRRSTLNTFSELLTLPRKAD